MTATICSHQCSCNTTPITLNMQALVDWSSFPWRLSITHATGSVKLLSDFACMFKTSVGGHVWFNACIGLGWLIHAPRSELTIIITSLDLAYKIGTCDLISDSYVLSYRPPQQQPWIAPLLVFPSSAWLTVSNHCGNSLSTTTPSQPHRATRTGWIVTFHLPQPQHQEQYLTWLAVKKQMEDIAAYRDPPLELIG